MMAAFEDCHLDGRVGYLAGLRISFHKLLHLAVGVTALVIAAGVRTSLHLFLSISESVHACRQSPSSVTP